METNFVYYFKHPLPTQEIGLQILKNSGIAYTLFNNYQQITACKLVCWKMPTNHVCKLTFTLPQAVSKVYVEVLPHGLQKAWSSRSMYKCIVSQKQAYQMTSICFGMYNKGCRGWTVLQALCRFITILDMTSKWSTNENAVLSTTKNESISTYSV